MQIKKIPKKLILIEICLCGILLGLVFASRAIFKYVDFLNGYSYQGQMLFYCFALILIRTYPFKIGFWLLAPFGMLAFGISGNIFFDYLLPYWGFFLFIFYESIREHFFKKHQWLWCILLTIAFNIVGYIVMLFSYTISGVLVFGFAFEASIAYNGLIAGVSGGINIGVMMCVSYPMSLLSKWNKKNIDIYY